MLNRRHLRIKILQALYAYFQAKEFNLSKAEKELLFSIDKMYEMYVMLLLLLEEVLLQAETRIEEGKKKRLPTEEDLDPNTRFVDNKLLLLIRENRPIEQKVSSLKVSWVNEREMIKKLYKELRETPEFEAYMTSAEKPDFNADKELIVKLFKKYIINHEALALYFEERSIFWVDDLDIVASMVIKTLKKFSEAKGSENELLPLYKDPEDEIHFVKTLFRKTILNYEETTTLIRTNAQNWEVERIALMDMLLMQMALAEVREFPQIPVKVSLNEYIEISKYYSTPKSNGFINGILDKLFAEMQENGEIRKTGRGLIN